jgi:GT2 family glycosyltransferase
LPAGVEVIVVDNASGDGGVEQARAARPDAVMLRSERNLGFSGGCNRGWRAARGRYIAFINPDVRVRPGALERLVARVAAAPHGVAGPQLVDAGGRPRPLKAEPSPRLDVLGLLPAAARWAPPGWDGKLARDDPRCQAGGAVPCLEGACFVIARRTLEAIGGLDEAFFLYYEEEALALRLRGLGGSAIYEPSAVAEHLGGTSTAKAPALSTRQLHRSRVIFYRKRDGELRGRTTAMALALAALTGAVAALVNGTVGRHRRTDLGYWWHVLHGLLEGATASLAP